MQKIKKTAKHRCLVCGKSLPNKTQRDKQRKYCSQKCMGIASSYNYKLIHNEKTRLEEKNKISDTKKNK